MSPGNLGSYQKSFIKSATVVAEMATLLFALGIWRGLVTTGHSNCVS